MNDAATARYLQGETQHLDKAFYLSQFKKKYFLINFFPRQHILIMLSYSSSSPRSSHLPNSRPLFFFLSSIRKEVVNYKQIKDKSEF